MSMKALEWAMYQVPSEMVKGALLRILLLLADHADTQGKGAFPSQKRIVALTGYSRRTIQNGLHELEAAGLIRRGDQRITEHLGKYRPVVWDLTMKDFRGAKNTPLEQSTQEAQHTAPLNKLEGRNQGRKKTSLEAQPGAQHDCAQNLYKEEPYIEPRESNARARKSKPISSDWKPSEEHRALADRLGIALGISGVHPFSPWTDQRIIDTPRRRSLQVHRPRLGLRHRKRRLGREIPHLAQAWRRTRLRHVKSPGRSPQVHVGER